MSNSAYDQLNQWLYTQGNTTGGSDQQSLLAVQGLPSSDSSLVQVGGLVRLDPRDGILVGPSPGMSQGTQHYIKAPFQVDVDGHIRSVGTIRLVAADDPPTNIVSDGYNLTSNSLISIIRAEGVGGNTLAFYVNPAGSDPQFNFQASSLFPALRVHTDSQTMIGIEESAITDAAAQNCFTVSLKGDRKGAFGITINWAVKAFDGTDMQQRVGQTMIAVVRKGDLTLATTITNVSEVVAVSAGTLTGTWSVTDGADLVTVAFTPNSSLTPTDVTMGYSVSSFHITGLYSDGVITKL